MVIDILIPCAGDGKYFEEAINSALNQSYQDIIIYVLDNACTHSKYKDVVESINNKKIIYIRFDKRLSMTENWQRCLSIGKSEFIAFLHDDDIWKETYIGDAIWAVKKNQAKLCLTAHVNFYDDLTNVNTNKVKEIMDSFSKISLLNESIRSFVISTSNSGHMSALLFKREAIGFPFNSCWMPDQVFLATYLCYNEAVYVQNVNVLVRLSKNNVTSSINSKGFIMVETINHLRQVIEFYVVRKGLVADDLYNSGVINSYSRYKQACFSWPLNHILTEFGYSMIKIEQKHNNIKILKKILCSIKATYWVIASLAADLKYFLKDL